MTIQEFADSLGIKIHYERIRLPGNVIGDTECYLGAHTLDKKYRVGWEMSDCDQIYAHGNNKKIALHNLVYKLKKDYLKVIKWYSKRQQKALNKPQNEFIDIPKNLKSGLEGTTIKVDGMTVTFN
jgi:hypothetical protein